MTHMRGRFGVGGEERRAGKRGIGREDRVNEQVGVRGERVGLRGRGGLQYVGEGG